MSIEFTNSEFCKIDGENKVYLRDPIRLLKDIQNLINEVGPEKFLSSPNERIKKARESMAGCFFLLEFQSQTSDFLFLMQPDEDPPDFYVMKVGREIESMTLNPIELLEVPSLCQSFEEMMSIINKKINKGYSENYNLLIFINNENCKAWLPRLHKEIKEFKPFLSVWTVHLLVYPNHNYQPVVNRLRPFPVIHIEEKLENIKSPNEIPDFSEEINIDGKRFLNFKKEFVNEFIKKIKKYR